VLDVLVRPVEAIPKGQGGQLVDEIKITAAGSAGGTAITLAKLGAEVRSAGAIGRDAAGEMLTRLLERGGVDTSLLVRRDEAQTSASVLPIRPSGERPALHVVGANATYGPDDLPVEAFEWATHLHLGGPEFMGGEAAASMLAAARQRGVVTSADVLAPGEMAVLDWIAPALTALDYFLPNEEQILGFTGWAAPRPASSPPASARTTAISRSATSKRSSLSPRSAGWPRLPVRPGASSARASASISRCFAQPRESGSLAGPPNAGESLDR
jgi:sugar/nucleoside kinase (ribokinase family)